MFHELDFVKIIAIKNKKDFMGSDEIKRAPKIGDTGTIVDIFDNKVFIVESCDNQGRAIFITDFSADELELIKRYKK